MSLSIKLTAAAIAVTAAATTGSAGAEQRERATLSRLTDSRQHLSLFPFSYTHARTTVDRSAVLAANNSAT